MVLSSHHKKLTGYYSGKNDISTEITLYGYFQGMRPMLKKIYTKHQTIGGGGNAAPNVISKHKNCPIISCYFSVNIL